MPPPTIRTAVTSDRSRDWGSLPPLQIVGNFYSSLEKRMSNKKQFPRLANIPMVPVHQHNILIVNAFQDLISNVGRGHAPPALGPSGDLLHHVEGNLFCMLPRMMAVQGSSITGCIHFLPIKNFNMAVPFDDTFFLRGAFVFHDNNLLTNGIRFYPRLMVPFAISINSQPRPMRTHPVIRRMVALFLCFHS